MTDQVKRQNHLCKLYQAVTTGIEPSTRLASLQGLIAHDTKDGVNKHLHNIQALQAPHMNVKISSVNLIAVVTQHLCHLSQLFLAYLGPVFRCFQGPLTLSVQHIGKGLTSFSIFE